MSKVAAEPTAQVPNNLVAPVTSFVGRLAEIEDVRQLLADARLVTLTGPPGAGKTRLAEEVAARTLGRFAGGTWFVELAALVDPALVLSAAAEALGILPSIAAEPIDALAARIADRSVLIIFDNFEHVTEAGTALAELLSRAPSLHVLVTSRTLLRLSAEHEYIVAPLRLPPHGASGPDLMRAEAVQLFVGRASTSDATFEVTDANAADVAELCRRLDGLPLALELAAARVRLLPVAAIAARVDHSLALLSDGPRDVPARHRSLRAAVDWSYELLDPPSRQLFRRLAGFRGGWTLEAAAAVFGPASVTEEAILGILGSLVDSSLVVRDAAATGEPRFTMLETLREYGLDQLVAEGEMEDVRSRHATHYRDVAEREAPEFTGSDPGLALDRVGVEHDNIRAALAHFLVHDPESALRLGAAMWRFWQMRGHLLEGERWIGAAITAAGPDAAADVRADAFSAIGSLAYWRGDLATAQPPYEAALDLRRALGDDIRTADAMYDLSFIYAPYFFPQPVDPDMIEPGARLLREARALYRQTSNAAGVAKTGWMLGNRMLYEDLPEAERMLRASVDEYRGLHDPFGLGWALRMHGCSLLGIGDTASASAEFREALRLFEDARDGSALGLLLGHLADASRADGDGPRAARLRGAAAGLRKLTEAGLANVEDVPWLARIRPLAEVISQAAYDRAVAEGADMSQAEAVTYALTPASQTAVDRTLRVSALGPFHVERAGARMTNWGGAKAGSRQAQAMFAFLMDRGDRGVTKDEFIEVIWPDAEVAQGDLNFHRTLGGLRGVLEPDRAGPGTVVAFANGRYRLDRDVIGWNDVAEFERHTEEAAAAGDDLAAIRSLEKARALYRGDYLDDCPLYGDSEYVEDRRTTLRGRLTDALVDLGRRYEARGEAVLSAARYRQALGAAGGSCPAASDGLERLGAARAPID